MPFVAGTYKLLLSVSTSGSALSTSSNFPNTPSGRNWFYVGCNPSAVDSGVEDATCVYVNSQISLDGGSPVAINVLPIGFQVIGGSQTFKSTNNDWPGAMNQRFNLIPNTEFSKIITTIPITGGGTFTNTLVGFASAQAVSAPNIAFNYQIVSDLLAPITFELLTNNGAHFTTMIDQNIEIINGIYALLSSTITITNITSPTLPPNTYIPGDILRVTVTDPDLDLTQIVSVDFGGLAGDLGVQGPAELLITLPHTTPPITPNTFLTAMSTQFSGSVLLGILSPLLTDASGIYSIIPGKTHDTVYTNTPTGNTTADIAIPNPFFKTGFIGG